MFKLRNRLQQIAEKISLMEWPDIIGDFDLLEENLFNLNIGNRKDKLFLGYYSQSGLKIVMEKYKISQKLSRLGFNNLNIEIDTSDPYKHRLSLNNKIHSRIEKLVEFVVKRDFIEIDMPFKTPLNGQKFEVLIVEWLMMQNPRKTFSKNKPILPGQDHPGLGIGSDAVELLVLAARRLGLKGIVNIPDHYHNAFFYSRIFYFEKPQEQARLLAIMRCTKRKTIGETAWIIEDKKLIDDNTAQPFKWEISRQILPLEKKLRRLYQSYSYKNTVNKLQKNYNFIIKE